MTDNIEKILHNKLNELAEFSYSDGCILFHTSFCSSEELSNIANSSMLKTIARILAEEVKLHLDR